MGHHLQFYPANNPEARPLSKEDDDATRSVTVQIYPFGQRLNRQMAKGRCSARLLLSAAVLAFSDLSAEEKAEWLKRAHAKLFTAPSEKGE